MMGSYLYMESDRFLFGIIVLICHYYCLSMFFVINGLFIETSGSLYTSQRVAHSSPNLTKKPKELQAHNCFFCAATEFGSSFLCWVLTMHFPKLAAVALICKTIPQINRVSSLSYLTPGKHCWYPGDVSLTPPLLTPWYPFTNACWTPGHYLKDLSATT